MSRKIFINLIACLLCLLPDLSFAQSLTTYEYWFDDSFGSRQSGSLSGTNTVVRLSVGTDQLGAGVHKFSFRAKQSDGKYSAVTSSLFLKRPAAQSSQMEYWFDDNFDGRDFLDISNTEEEQTFELDLRNGTKYPFGLHKLNMRIALEGDGWSAVYSAPVLKLAAGRASQLEYWVDGDYANVRTIGGTPTEDGTGFKFVTDLDLGNITPGHHRLYCRPVSNSRITAGAVTSMPIIVKSRYNIDPAAVKMKSFTIAVDNEDPVTINVNKDDEIILNPYTLNVHDLNTGNHTLKAHFWNTANAGVALEQNFTVNAIETPTITLTAQEKEGRVTLKFNSIPNDVKWGIVRTDANGVNVKIDGKTESCYPSEITSVDNPLPGAYKYKARGYYIDADGTRKAVNSNEVEVAVVASQNGPFGSISGTVRINGNTPFGINWDINFSDGVTVETNFTGSYFRNKIPVGTVLEITPKSRDYSCDPVTITIKEGSNYVLHEAVFEEELVRSRYTSDLEFDSNVEFEPRLHMKFKVRNRTRLPWNGRLCIVTGRKDFMDNPPNNPLEQSNWTPETQQLAGGVAPFVINDNLQYDYSDKIHLLKGESKEVFITHHIPLTSPPSFKDELYYFFVESIDDYGTKLVAVNDDYNIKENPLVQLVNNGQYDAEKQGEQDVESCVAIIMGLCSTVTEFDGKLGDMSRCMDEMQQTLGYTLDYYDLAEKIERTASYSNLHHDIPEWEFYNILFYEDRRFLGMVNSVRDKISKEVRACKDVLTYLKKAKKCIDAVKEYRQWNDMTDLERTGSIAERILNLAENEYPFAKVLKMYLDVTKNTIHNINGLAEKWYANHDYFTFYNGEGIYAGSDFSFDIKIKKKSWLSSSFSAEDVKDRILSVEINCIGHAEGNDPFKCVATYTPEVIDGKLRLQRVNITGDNPDNGGIVPIEDMWMTIWWSNGRVSHIPIRNGKDMKGNGVTHDKNHYTITFQSATNDIEHMADIIFLDD